MKEIEQICSDFKRKIWSFSTLKCNWSTSNFWENLFSQLDFLGLTSKEKPVTQNISRVALKISLFY